MPFFIDGDVKLTESKSIMKYICKKHDPKLLGRDALEVAQADMISRIHDSMHQQFSGFVKTVGDSEELQKKITDNGKLLSDFLGEKKFMVGDDVVFSDFCMFELLEAMDWTSNGECYKTYPNLKEYIDRIKQLPNFKEYWEDDERGQKRPYRSKDSKFFGADGST